MKLNSIKLQSERLNTTRCWKQVSWCQCWRRAEAWPRFCKSALESRTCWTFFQDERRGSKAMTSPKTRQTAWMAKTAAHLLRSKIFQEIGLHSAFIAWEKAPVSILSFTQPLQPLKVLRIWKKNECRRFWFLIAKDAEEQESSSLHEAFYYYVVFIRKLNVETQEKTWRKVKSKWNLS